MRVITGTARGRKLHEVTVKEIRPTSDMVKESIFNIIQFDIEGRRVLDLFAGTGQLGIEAASRGAESVTFIDKNRNALNLIRKNLDHCELNGIVREGDSLMFLKNCSEFDLIFVDPPYESGLYVPAIEKILEFDILSKGGIIVCESRMESAPPEFEGLRRKTYKYGKICITIYTREVD